MTDSPKKQNRVERFLANCFLVLVVTVVAFAVAEIACRYFLVADNPFKVAQVRDLRAPKPYVTFGGVPNSGGLNRLGYPGPAPTLEKPAGEVRIAVLGGSTVMLGPVTITDLIQKELDRRGFSAAKVYNFGTAGSNATQDYARLVFEVAEIDPDIVVFYNGGNDILSRAPDDRLGYPYNFLLWEVNPVVEPTLDGYPALRLFLFGSALMRTLFPDYFVKGFVESAYRNGVAPLRESDPKFAETLAAHYVKMSARAAQFAKMIGAEPLILFQPILYYKKNKSGWEARSSITNAGFLEKAEAFRQQVVRELAAHTAAGTFPSADLTEAFDANDNKNPVYTDFIHLTPFGKKHMARLVTDQLIRSAPRFFPR